MGDTVSKAVDLEARRRAMEDNLRRFREVEQRQQPAFRTPIGPSGRTFTTGEITTPEERLALSAPPSPEDVERQLRAREGTGLDFLSGVPTSPEEAARLAGRGIAGTGVGDVIRRGFEEFQTRVSRPFGAAALQVAESPAGGGLLGVTELKGVQRRLEEVGVPEELSPLPRERTFEEALEGGFVDQFAALIGNKAEQEKAQAVLEEAGLPRALAAEVLFDFTNLFPGMGLTKVDDFARLLRIATKATGAGKARAVKVLAESDLLQQARRGIKAGERGGGPLRGGDIPQSIDDLSLPSTFKRTSRDPRLLVDESGPIHIELRLEPSNKGFISVDFLRGGPGGPSISNLRTAAKQLDDILVQNPTLRGVRSQVLNDKFADTLERLGFRGRAISARSDPSRIVAREFTFTAEEISKLAGREIAPTPLRGREVDPH
ncbi:hypothetical protein LCGC14_2523920, partial [marine sediment metagenome]